MEDLRVQSGIEAYCCDGRDDRDGGADDSADGGLLLAGWVFKGEGGVLVDGFEALAHGGG